MTRTREDIREEARILLRGVEDTLARPRPPQEARWVGLPQAKAPTAAPQAASAALMDTIAQGVGMALQETAEALLSRISELETRLAALEARK